MSARAAVVLAVASAGLIAAAGLYAARGRARHLAVPVLVDPSLAPAPPDPLAEAGDAGAVEVARVGARVTALLESAEGELWIGTYDAGIAVRTPSGELRAQELAGRERLVNALAEHDGLVWAATQGGLLAFDGERRVAAALAGEAVSALARAGGALYAGTARGVHRIEVGGAVAVDAAGPAGEPLRVTALAAGAEALWIGTSSGAYALPLASVRAPLLQRTARWYPLVFGDPPAETNVVTALAPLGDGVVAGTDDGGVVRLGPGGAAACARFADARANEVNPGAAAASEGVAFFGTQGGGLLVVRASGARLAASRPRDLSRAAVSAVAPSPSGLLVGTADGAVLRLPIPDVLLPDPETS
jgi:ligand-binding sensor domain-containing protein